MDACLFLLSSLSWLTLIRLFNEQTGFGNFVLVKHGPRWQQALVADRRTVGHASCCKTLAASVRMQMFVCWGSGQSFGGQIYGQLFLLRQLETMCSAQTPCCTRVAPNEARSTDIRLGKRIPFDTTMWHAITTICLLAWNDKLILTNSNVSFALQTSLANLLMDMQLCAHWPALSCSRNAFVIFRNLVPRHAQSLESNLACLGQTVLL